MAMFDEDAKKMFFGVVLIAGSIVFLLSGLGVFKSNYYIVSYDVDVLIAFFLMIVGLAYVFSEVGKPGKPKYEVQLKESRLH